jgi:hypothetical protein
MKAPAAGYDGSNLAARRGTRVDIPEWQEAYPESVRTCKCQRCCQYEDHFLMIT